MLVQFSAVSERIALMLVKRGKRVSKKPCPLKTQPFSLVQDKLFAGFQTIFPPGHGMDLFPVRILSHLCVTTGHGEPEFLR